MSTSFAEASVSSASVSGIPLAGVSLADVLPLPGVAEGESQRDQTAAGGEFASLHAGREVFSTGFRGIDALLPAGGVRSGSLIEWLSASPDTEGGKPAAAREASGPSRGESWCDGVLTLAMATAVQLSGGQLSNGQYSNGQCSVRQRPRAVLVVDRSGWFYPPAVMGWLGDGRGQLIVARPSRDDDEAWAIDQALRCEAVAAVVACPSARVTAATTMRRWQLAARASGVVGLLVRPWQCHRDPSWADARLVVSPRATASLADSHQAGNGPRSRATLRRWQVERLASVIHSEGCFCEVMIDLERGVEVSPSAWQQRQRNGLLPQGRWRSVGPCRAEQQQKQKEEEVSCRAS